MVCVCVWCVWSMWYVGAAPIRSSPRDAAPASGSHTEAAVPHGPVKSPSPHSTATASRVFHNSAAASTPAQVVKALYSWQTPSDLLVSFQTHPHYTTVCILLPLVPNLLCVAGTLSVGNNWLNDTVQLTLTVISHSWSSEYHAYSWHWHTVQH